MFRIFRQLLVITVIMITFSFVAFSGELKSLDLQSKDIACPACALSIKRAINAMEGVKQVKVSAGTKKIHVEYDSGNVTENQIIQKITGLGFKVKNPE